MREYCTSESVRGALGNRRPYRGECGMIVRSQSGYPGGRRGRFFINAVFL